MPNAASLTEAINVCQENLVLDSNGTMFKTALAGYNAALLGTSVGLDLNNINQRTVANWCVLISEFNQASVEETATPAQIFQANDVICRQLYATMTAETEGRITGAQATAILAAYNTHIALF